MPRRKPDYRGEKSAKGRESGGGGRNLDMDATVRDFPGAQT